MQRILAADMGGTNCRMGFFELPAGAESPVLLDIARLKTADVSSFADLLARLFSLPQPFGPQDCHLAVLAVPGPVRQGFCRPPNIPWSIDLADALRAGFAESELLNDFAAQAHACRSSAMDGAEVLQRGSPDPAGAVAVIGAGTGLGHCALVRCGQGVLAVPSEAGHAAFPFVDDWEHAYGKWVCAETGLPYCHGDAIVTGGGLARLSGYLSGVRTTPQQAAAGLGQAPQVVERFARFYGRAARNYALYVLAAGGVYITGGVSGRNPELVRHPAFLDEFRASPSHAELLARMPVFLNLNQDAGVFGAAHYAAQRLRGFGATA